MIALNGSALTLEQLLAIADAGEGVTLAAEAAARVRAARQGVEAHARGDEPVYGVNTGFGSFAEVKIARIHPVVPSRGSVGASGDLAPLAHVALVVVGEGHATCGDDPAPLAGGEALARAGLRPATLAAKEGLALINGTQPSTAVLALALAGAEQLARAADIAAALSIDALRGSIHPFERRIHEARPFPGQVASAANIERLLRGSAINKSHEHCGKVQDAYSLRCAPQVH